MPRLGWQHWLVVVAVTACGAPHRGTPWRTGEAAAPASIVGMATLRDGARNLVREGTNGWTCADDHPLEAGNTPVCYDDQFAEFIRALQEGRAPRYDRIGFAYMLQGGEGGSNTDPFARAPTDDNHWIAVEDSPPVILMVTPDASWLNGLSTDPSNGGPWVMWKGTPWVHAHIPTTRKPPGPG